MTSTRPTTGRSAGSAPLGARWWGYALALPALVLMVVFFLYPVWNIASHAFTKWDGIDPARFTGLDNLVELFRDGDFFTAVRNNVLFALFVPVQVVFSLVVAVLIHEHTPGWRLFRGVFFLPVVMSPVVIGIVWTAIFALHGPLNVALEGVGLGDLATNWLAQPSTSIPAIMVVVLWATFGFNMMLFLSGLSTMSPLLIDAARVDGAGWWSTLRHVIVPSLRRVLELVVVLNLIAAFAYMLPYVFVMTGGGPGRETYVVELLIYDEGFTFGHLGYASAISLALFLMVGGLMLLYVRRLGRAE
jgi:multiple sugar transport system permease protein/raffinose/stachyose/melibiose transport system permease protein